jgi:hypothetical protein
VQSPPPRSSSHDLNLPGRLISRNAWLPHMFHCQGSAHPRLTTGDRACTGYRFAALIIPATGVAAGRRSRILRRVFSLRLLQLLGKNMEASANDDRPCPIASFSELRFIFSSLGRIAIRFLRVFFTDNSHSSWLLALHRNARLLDDRFMKLPQLKHAKPCDRPSYHLNMRGATSVARHAGDRCRPRQPANLVRYQDRVFLTGPLSLLDSVFLA